MTTEAAGLIEQMKVSDRVRHISKVIRKKRRKKVRIQLLRRPDTTLQELFESCRDVFKGPAIVPSPTDVQKLCRIIDKMKPEDVGLSQDQQFFKHGSEIEGPPRVTSATIYKCGNFELCIFFLPSSGIIPLHNHPGMTVFSKLLLGSMHIKAYDWVDPDSPSQRGLAKLKVNQAFTAPCDTSVLYPTSGGNMHEFRAITPCAVLDVIGPPYSKDDGRDCSYYKDTPADNTTILDKEEYANDDIGSFRWLEEIEKPDESEMDGIAYMGPQIVDLAAH